MITLPSGREVLRLENCSAERFDEAFLQVTKGEGVQFGYFRFADGELDRFLLISGGEPLCAALDDGDDGRVTLLSEFFGLLLSRPRDIAFHSTDKALVEMMAAAWQRMPDALVSAGFLPPLVLLDSAMSTGREAALRIRRAQSLCFAYLKGGEVSSFYAASPPGVEAADPERALREELSREPKTLALAVYENPIAARSEDWAVAPPDFQEGMARFYCHTSPHLIISLSGREVRRIPLTAGRTTIGRDPACDLVIDNLSVSRRHAAVDFVNGVCTIEDTGSSNGTFVAGERICGPVQLSDGEEATIGKHTLRFIARALRSGTGSVPAAGIDQTVFMRAPQFDSLEFDEVPLLTVGGKDLAVRNTPFTIGSAEGADLTLEGHGIKPKHAELNSDPDGRFHITHTGGLLSATRVNGRKVKIALLQSGDLLQIGSVLLRFHFRSPSNSLQ